MSAGDARVYVVAIDDSEDAFLKLMAADVYAWAEVTQTPVTTKMGDAIVTNVENLRSEVLP